MGSWNFLAPVEADVAIALVIRNDDDDVRAVGSVQNAAASELETGEDGCGGLIHVISVYDRTLPLRWQ